MKTITFIILAIVCLQIHASEPVLKVMRFNNPEITIGKEKCVVGLEFDDEALIHWKTDKDAIEVLNTATGRRRVLTTTKLNHSKNISLLGKKRLATRGDDSLDELIDELREIAVFESIIIESPISTDEQGYFVLRVDAGEGKSRSIELNGDTEGNIYIEAHQLRELGFDCGDYQAGVYYLDKSTGEATPVNEHCTLRLLCD